MIEANNPHYTEKFPVDVADLPVDIAIGSFFNNIEVEVYDYNPTTGVLAQLVENTNYIVIGANNPSGGTVTVNSKHFVGISEIRTLIRIPISQLVQYSRNDDFPAKTHETALDKIVRMVQELNRKTANVLTLDPIDGGGGFLPLADRKGKFIVFDNDGDVILSGDLQTAVDAAETSALNAFNSATAAATSELIAESHADDALTSLNSATTLYNTFRGVFYGELGNGAGNHPAVRPVDGSAVQTGDLYYSSLDNLFYSKSSTIWVAIDTVSVANSAAAAEDARDIAGIQATAAAVESEAAGISAGEAFDSAEAAAISASQALTSRNSASASASAAGGSQFAAENSAISAANSATTADGLAAAASAAASAASSSASSAGLSAGDSAQSAVLAGLERFEAGQFKDQTQILYNDTVGVKTDIETAFGVLSTDPQAMVKLMYNVHSINLPVSMTVEEDERAILLDELVVGSGKVLTINGKVLIHPYEE